MRNEHSTSSRRQFLSLAAGTGTVALAGCTTALSNQLFIRTDDASMTVDPDTAGLDDDEREQYIDRMAERYGTWAADKIVVGDVDLQPGLMPTDLVWDGEQSLSVTDSEGTTLAESDNYAAVYETNEEFAADENEYYVYWLWSCARPQETGKLHKLWSHVNIMGDGDVLVYDPGGDVTDNGTISPHAEKTGQDTDEFAVQWQGDHTETQVVTGSLSERRNDGERSFKWAVHLASKAR